MVDKSTDAAATEASKPTEATKKESSQGHSASIGPSITINGDVTGEENLVVEGVIEGTVNLKDNNLVVSENGRLTANITARIIRVDGEVKGELRGSEQVIISPTGQVSGDIRAPGSSSKMVPSLKGQSTWNTISRPPPANAALEALAYAPVPPALSAPAPTTIRVARLRLAEPALAGSQGVSQWDYPLVFRLR
ncbi:MAG: hypothetical protein CM1200mP41_11660 [Gammaproteobacteria bacterium]|nr:MAG: hypothetical protein CM1200mP41_11660 [Gammaproteobacteria bacterium]